MTSAAMQRLHPPTDQPSLWLAVILSLAIHTLIVYLYPRLNLLEVIKLPQRIEVQMDTKVLPPVVEPVPPPPKGEQLDNPEPPKPKEKPVQKPKPEQPKPVLTSQAPEASQQYVAPPAPEPVEQAPKQQSTEKIAAYGTPDGREDSKVEVVEAPPENASDDEAWNGYGQQLYDMVSRNKNYPAIAVRRNMEGEVTILAKFNKGELVSVSIVQPSGHKPLDDEAIRMVKKAIADLAVKGSLSKKSFNIKVPVSFKLDQA